MNIIQKRFALFLLLCIPARILLVFLAKFLKGISLKILALVLLIPAFGFLYLFFSGKRPTGGEVFGNKIWWNNLRPIHGLNYLVFSSLVLSGVWVHKAWIILLFDVALGFLAFLIYHYKSNNFPKLLECHRK